MKAVTVAPKSDNGKGQKVRGNLKAANGTTSVSNARNTEPQKGSQNFYSVHTL